MNTHRTQQEQQKQQQAIELNNSALPLLANRDYDAAIVAFSAGCPQDVLQTNKE
jgi:hypothetical protein